jgi:plasmid maintenance system antidote protein VapI
MLSRHGASAADAQAREAHRHLPPADWRQEGSARALRLQSSSIDRLVCRRLSLTNECRLSRGVGETVRLLRALWLTLDPSEDQL